ncbi:MAG: hypothetical protein P1U78_12310 [Alcanivoracaceae bacterium]|nr:hypothetical protein [Alcanivoracaceae bacterium]
MWSGSVRVAIPGLLLLGLVLLPLLTLWPALPGPFLFDDEPNLNALQVLQGEVNLDTVGNYLAEKSAGPTGRPLSMLSFLLNDVYWPSEPASFKYTNLLIHILNGLLLAWLVLAIVRQWAGKLDQRHVVLALLVTAFWVLNPYQLSSVMYVVQRMAQLSALCVLAGLLLYLSGRRLLADGDAGKGYGLIWLAYLVGAGVGVLAKENAALFVLLVPLFEWLLFPASVSRSRPLLLKATLALPAAAMLMVLGSYFFSTHAYEWFRDFTLSERLLSQGRALGYYLWRYLIPGVGYVGLYADGFEKSVGLLQPLSTLVWIVAHLLIIALAVVYARRLPLLSLGILFFYVAHSMESGAIPLELFFEHRNYLPSMLLLLGVFHLPRQKVAIMALVPVVLVCAALQYLQATFWGDERHLNTIMVVENPSSERALVTYANYLERQGDLVDSLVVMKQYIEQHPYGMDVALNAVKMSCHLGIDSEQDASMLVASTAKYRGKAEPVVRQVGDIAKWVSEGKCKSITLEHLSRFLDSYMRAYPRDGEATQAQYVARSYLDYYRGNYAGFHQHMSEALDAHPNLSLTYSGCSQFAVIGGPEQGCECFKKYQYIVDKHGVSKKTLVQKLLRRTDSDVDSFRSEAAAVCAAVDAQGDVQPENSDGS